MGLIDFILSVAAVLLWVAWRTAQKDALAQPRALTLISTLKRTGPMPLQSWTLPLSLLVLLVGRSLLYWQLGKSVGFTPKISLISLTLFFRCDFLGQMIAYSTLSFVVALLVYYIALTLISLLHHRAANSNVMLGFVRGQLGWLEKRSLRLKILTPLTVTAVLWIVISPLLVWMSVLTRPESVFHLIEQAVVIGLGSYSVWQIPLGIILLLHLVNSYVYLGRHPFWDLVSESGRRILLPLRWLPLRLGKLDFAPLVAIALVFFLGQQLVTLLPRFYNRLPL